MSKYEGRRALITGASSGIGAEFARQLHALGSSVILVARRKDRLSVLSDELNKIRPGSARFIVCDLARHESIDEILGLDAFLSFLKTEEIDILVNNAGRGTFGVFEINPLEEEQDIIDLNVTAFMRVLYVVVPSMKKRREGRIVNVSSIAAFQPIPFMATYAASKAFNFNLSVALRSELISYGIKVTALCPGPIGTEFSQVAKVPGGFSGLPNDSVSRVVKAGLQALERNLPYIVPGFGSKILAFMSRWVPERLSTWITKLLLMKSIGVSGAK